MSSLFAHLPKVATRPTAAALAVMEGGSPTSRVRPGNDPGTQLLADMAWQEIPVFIVNRNRHVALQRLVEWLKDCGTRNVCILDNASTYQPLLDWYGKLPADVRLVRFDANLGPWVFWAKNLHKTLDMPYVVSDSDLVPADFCPPDLIAKLQETLCRFPDAKKVGPSLRIDNLPGSYAQAQTAFKWESQFWEKPVAHGLFSAPIDTTFALYAPSADFTRDMRNIRMGYPYTMEHTPWLVDDSALSHEEQYYRANTSREYSHWSGATQLNSSLDQSERIQGYEQRARVLHLGGGDEHIPGWINVDSQGRKLDFTFAFEQCGGERLPLEDDSVDGVYMSHSLQHVRDAPSLLRELYRVARPDARLFIRVPHGASTNNFADPRSVRPWFEDSFDQLAAPQSRNLMAGFDWQLEDRMLVVSPDMLAIDPIEAETIVRRHRNVVQEMCITLRAVKHGRGADVVAERAPPIRFTADPRLEPKFEVVRKAGSATVPHKATVPSHPVNAAPETSVDSRRIVSGEEPREPLVKQQPTAYRHIYDTVYQKSPIYAEQMDVATGRSQKDEIILGAIGYFSPTTLVDLGCGQGHYVRHSRAMGIDAIGVEVSATCCQKYLQDIPHLNTDAETFLRLGNRYEFLLSTDVLEHIGPSEIDVLLQLAAPAAPNALFGIANHSDIQLGVELHLIREAAPWWVERLKRVYDKVEVLGELYEGRFFFLLCGQPKR
jgi:SAM-dependent methyltransferase